VGEVGRVSITSGAPARQSRDLHKGKATYVYCLVVAATRPRLAGMPAGLPGTGPVRLIEVDRERYLAAADAPLSRYGEAAIQRGFADLAWVSRAAVAHEAVVEAFIGATAVLPMKLFTLFTSDDRALVHLQRDRRRIEALIKRVAGHLEWGVRLVLNPVRRDPAGTRSAKGQLAARHTGMRTGITYLNQKRAQLAVARERAERARTIAAALFDVLSERSREARRRAPGELPVQPGPLLLDAAFLVSRARARAFTSLVQREQRKLARDGYDVILTGPWPPYSFVQGE